MQNISRSGIQNRINFFENLIKSSGLSDKNNNNAFKEVKLVKNTSIDIDSFIQRVVNLKTQNEIMEKGKIIGAGGYGTAVKIKDLAIKVTVNRKKESVYLQDNIWGAPLRTSRYLNEFNGKDYSRAALTKDNKEVLVSKYIEGEAVNNEAEVKDVLQSKGFVIYDAEQPGNLKKDKDGKYWLIDADLVVHKPRNRKLSEATYFLEHFLKNSQAADLRKIENQIIDVKSKHIPGTPNKLLSALTKKYSVAKNNLDEISNNIESRPSKINETHNYTLLKR